MTLAEPGSPNPVVYPEFRRRALQPPADLLYDPHVAFGEHAVAQGTPATPTGVRSWAMATARPGLDTRSLRSAIDIQHAIMTFLSLPLAERTPFSLDMHEVRHIRSFILRATESHCIAAVSRPARINWIVLTLRGIPAVGFGISAIELGTGDSIAINIQGDIVRWWEPEEAAAAVRLTTTLGWRR